MAFSFFSNDPDGLAGLPRRQPADQRELEDKMGYQRDERHFARGDEFYRGEFGRDHDRSARQEHRGSDFEDRIRSFFERAADEVRSWFSDEDAERRRQVDEREDSWRDREEHRDRGYRGFGQPGFRGQERWRDRERGFGASDADFGNYGYGNWGAYGRSRNDWSRDERFGDPHYRTWRDRQMEAFDRDYDDYRRENQSRFDSDFGSWRRQRDVQRSHIANIQEHAEVESSDGKHVGTVDKVRGERIILTKRDQEAGGRHHWIPTSWVANVEHNKVRLTRTHDDAQKHWHDAEDEDHNGPHILGRSFAGTY